MNFKSLPEKDKPREKLIVKGAESLTDSELLAIILGTGNKKEDVLTLSNNILQKSDLKKLSRTSISALEKNLGIGKAKSTQIAACFELGRRLNQSKKDITQIKKAKDVADLLIPEMQALDKEHLKVIFLNTRHSIIKVETVFIGTLNESTIHPREIFQRALEERAAAIILVHNHPSGDPTPSESDIETTHAIIKAGNTLDIQVLDHIILADTKYLSLREKGFI